jgi:integrase
VVGKGIVVTPPKTPAGNRTLFIPASLLPILEEALAISEGENQPWVCHHSEGGLMTTQLATPKFKKIAEEARVNGKQGLPDATHHDLRSTLLSWLANQANGGIGVRPATLKRIAGHSKLEVTMRYYVRATEEDVATAMSYIP